MLCSPLKADCVLSDRFLPSESISSEQLLSSWSILDITPRSRTDKACIFFVFCYAQTMLTQKDKEKIVEQHKVHTADTGSPEVQIALLSEEIRRLALHLKKHPKDVHSKRGLLKMVAKRRALLGYLKREEPKRYTGFAKKTGLKK